MKPTKSRFLTDKEKKELFLLKTVKKDIADNFTLTSKEIKYIEKFKKSYLKLGYALQYLLLKNFGRQLDNNIPLPILSYVGEQLKIQEYDLEGYLNNNVTRKRYFIEIYNILEFSRFKMNNQIEKIAENIMLPFYTTKGGAKGTGLGLSICQKIIKSHGGKIVLLPKEPNTTFILSIPF